MPQERPQNLQFCKYFLYVVQTHKDSVTVLDSVQDC